MGVISTRTAGLEGSGVRCIVFEHLPLSYHHDFDNVGTSTDIAAFLSRGQNCDRDGW